MGASKKAIIAGYLGLAILVVVVAMVLFPIFAKGRHKGPDPCMSNERQVGLALMQYAEDYNNRMPVGEDGKGAGWAGIVLPYIKSTDVFHCPDDPTTAPAPNVPVSYAYNENIARAGGSLKKTADPRAMVLAFEVAGDYADLSKPDEGAKAGAAPLSAAADGTDGSLHAGSLTDVVYATGYLGKRPNSGSTTQFAAPTGRHTDGANYLLGDGHVRWLMGNKVSSGSSALHPKDFQTGGVVGRAAGTENGEYQATFSTW
jgi:prepilin-type processing-associated H-X9-DG protein